MKPTIIRRRDGDQQLNARIAEITGQRSYVGSYFEDTATGAEYAFIAGGIGWGSGPVPSYAVVVGVDRPRSGAPAFRALEEVEAHGVEALLTKCLALRERWGFLEDSRLLTAWWGDYERHATILDRFNADLERRVTGKGLLTVVPAFYQAGPGWLDNALQQIRSLMVGEKRFHLGPCDRLRTALQELPNEKLTDALADRYPPVVALANVLEHLVCAQPWEVPLTDGTPLSSDGFEERDPWAT